MNLFFMIVFFMSTVLNGFLIDQSGRFQLGGDLLETTTDAVIIQANNVSLDLNESVVSSFFDGIVIKAGVSGVSVKNGTIAGVNGSGVIIEEGCRSIQFIDITIAQCNGSAIELRGTGTDVSQAISNIGLQNLTVSACALVTATNVIKISFGDNIFFNNTIINNSGNVNVDEINVCCLSDTSACLVSNILMTNNFGLELNCLHLIHTESSLVQRFNILSHQSLLNDLKGFILTDSCTGNNLDACNILSSSATNNIIGFEVTNGSNRNIFNNCNAVVLRGGVDVIGFDICGTVSPTDIVANIFERCAAADNIAITGTNIGFRVNRANDSIINGSSSVDNAASQGLAIGLHVTDLGGESWSFSRNSFLRNTGLDDANSFGIRDESGLINLYLQNFAFDNGNTAGNQMMGVPLGSQVQLNTGNLNTANTPWSNVAITPT
ncbi:MAG: hypothetical protein WDZ41_03645 [Candidatus Babeliales bacterium]